MQNNHRSYSFKAAAGLIAALLTIVALATSTNTRLAADAPEPAAPTQTSRVFMPATMVGRSTIWSSDSIFGVQMYYDSSPTSYYLPSLVESGATWLRIDINWSSVEPTNTTPDQYLWQYADQSLGAAVPSIGAGIRVIGTIETAPVWARSDSYKPDGPINPAYMGDFQEFVGALVERFDGDGYRDAPGSPVVTYWEFYNEPDRRSDSTDGRWGDHPVEYAMMLAAVYPVVKYYNPDAQVVFGGIAYDFFIEQGGPFVRSFLDDVLKAGAGDYFDIFNFHIYPIFAPNWLPPVNSNEGSGLYEKAQHLRQELIGHGLDKPIIVTEAGWRSDSTPSAYGNEEIQARYVAQLFTQSLAADLDIMIWWMLYDPSGWDGDYGLVNNDIPPYRKPSFTAYQTIVNRLTHKEFVRVVPLAETQQVLMEAYQFRDSATGRAHYVAWLNPENTSSKSVLTVAAGEVRTTNLYGVPGPTINDAADGAIDGRTSVTVDGQPVYIEVIR